MAQTGNGIDLGSVYRLLTEIAGSMRQHSERLDTIERRTDEMVAVLNQHTRVLNEHSQALNDHSRQLDDLQLGMAEMRQEVAQYHAAVTSQGIHYSELEGRTLKIERHLKLEPGE